MESSRRSTRQESRVDFDERLIRREHVVSAIKRYEDGEREKYPARSAFLVHNGRRYPAKHLIRLAFREATGVTVASEQLTGGKASVRVLQDLGFSALYNRPANTRANRNPIKNARRAAFAAAIAKRWGSVETEVAVDGVAVPDLQSRKSMDVAESRILSAIESFRGYSVRGRAEYLLKFDYYIPAIELYLEFDERQHFTPPRAVALRSYPSEVRLGFDKRRWISIAESIRAGDNSPFYRDEQRAFYDSIRDLRMPRLTGRPIVRIFEEDVRWELTGDSTREARRILDMIGGIG